MANGSESEPVDGKTLDALQKAAKLIKAMAERGLAPILPPGNRKTPTESARRKQ